MMKPKVKIRYRTRYRDRPPAQVEVSGDGPVTVGAKVSGALNKFNEFRQVAISVGTIVFGVWAFLLPYVNAQAEELLKDKLIDIGMDPANVQQLNKNLEELQKLSEERAGKVDELKSDIDKILTILEQQQRQPLYPPVMQAAPPPLAAQ